MDIKSFQNDIALARATGGGTRSPAGREPRCVKVAAEAVRDALAGRRAARRECVAAKRGLKEAT